MTKTKALLFALAWPLMTALVGIAVAGAPGKGEIEAKKIAAALAKLPQADRAAAESQRWCAVLENNRLGSMGTPAKVSVDGKAVFLCCAGCKSKATANGPATLAKVTELKKVTAALARLNSDDRTAAEAQRFCAVMDESTLGSMGVPLKVSVEGQSVFLCCKGCVKRAQADPKATLARVAKLKQAAEDSE